MDGCFQGVPADNIDRFLSLMILSDSALPHTSTRMSPITFTEFLARNSILCLNQMQVYDQACKFWRKYLSFSPKILEAAQGKTPMDICEQEHAGWNKLVDHFNRILDVQQFTNAYYQMHYLSHCFHLFYLENFKNSEERCCMRAIYNQIISPILYESCIPVAQYFWLPVMNFADMRFKEVVVLLCARITAYIEAHAGRTMNTKEFDKRNLETLFGIVKEGLQGVHENKYNDELWKVPLCRCLSQSAVVQADVDSCELHDSFEQDGMQCCKALRCLKNMKTRYDRDYLDNDPDQAIDLLLDTYSLLKAGLDTYEINKEVVPCK